MYPIIFTLPEWIPFLGGSSLYSFGVLVLLGAIAAMQWVKYESRRRGLDDEEIVGIAIEIFLAGLIGTRILFVAQNWDFFADKSWFSLINIREGGLVWYGGPLTALPIIWLRLRNYPVNPLVICDIWAPGLAIGHAIGRLGCLAVGDDYGKTCTEEAWYTLTFTDPNALLPKELLGKPLLPSQPAMFLGVFTIFCILVAVRKKIAHKPAALPALYFTLYPIHRFIIEQYLRGDPGAKEYMIPFLDISMRTSAIISILIFPFGLATLIYFLRRPDSVGTDFVDWDHAPERVQALRPEIEAKRAAQQAEAEAKKAKEAKAKGETKPAETKPADPAPAEAKPAEPEPAEAKPAEPEPAETKPAEPDAAQDTSPGDDETKE